MKVTAYFTGRIAGELYNAVTKNGKNVCSFTVAVNDFYGGEQHTEYVRCSAFEGAADYVNRHAKKGDLISVTGTMRASCYKDKNGEGVAQMQLTTSSIELYAFNKKEEQPHIPTEEEVAQTWTDLDSDDIPF